MAVMRFWPLGYIRKKVLPCRVLSLFSPRLFFMPLRNCAFPTRSSPALCGPIRSSQEQVRNTCSGSANREIDSGLEPYGAFTHGTETSKHSSTSSLDITQPSRSRGASQTITSVVKYGRWAMALSFATIEAWPSKAMFALLNKPFSGVTRDSTAFLVLYSTCQGTILGLLDFKVLSRQWQPRSGARLPGVSACGPQTIAPSWSLPRSLQSLEISGRNGSSSRPISCPCPPHHNTNKYMCDCGRRGHRVTFRFRTFAFACLSPIGPRTCLQPARPASQDSTARTHSEPSRQIPSTRWAVGPFFTKSTVHRVPRSGACASEISTCFERRPPICRGPSSTHQPPPPGGHPIPAGANFSPHK